MHWNGKTRHVIYVAMIRHLFFLSNLNWSEIFGYGYVFKKLTSICIWKINKHLTIGTHIRVFFKIMKYSLQFGPYFKSFLHLKWCQNAFDTFFEVWRDLTSIYEKDNSMKLECLQLYLVVILIKMQVAHKFKYNLE